MPIKPPASLIHFCERKLSGRMKDKDLVGSRASKFQHQQMYHIPWHYHVYRMNLN